MTRAGSKDSRPAAPVDLEVPRRGIVDYALMRRSTLAGLRAGSLRRHEVCDAQPELRNAAQHLGEPAGHPCPVCASTELAVTRWLYGAELGQSSGCCAYPGEERHVAADYAEVRVWVVEVCRG